MEFIINYNALLGVITMCIALLPAMDMYKHGNLTYGPTMTMLNALTGANIRAFLCPDYTSWLTKKSVKPV